MIKVEVVGDYDDVGVEVNLKATFEIATDSEEEAIEIVHQFFDDHDRLTYDLTDCREPFGQA